MKKNLFVALVMSLFVSTTAVADSIQWVINGSPGGTFHKRSTMYIEALKNNGYEVEVKDLKKSTQALEYFKKSDKPSAMVYIADLAPKTKYFHNDDNFVALEYVEGLYFCAKENAMEKDTILLGSNKSYNVTSFVKYLESIGKTVQFVPYENSGAVLQGIMGGDVDAIVTNQKTAVKWMKDNNSCVFNTSDSEALGVPSVTTLTDIEFPINASTVVAKNIDLDSLRKVIKQAQVEGDFAEWHKSVKLTPVTGLTKEQELEIVRTAEAGW